LPCFRRDHIGGLAKFIAALARSAHGPS
jgi:hypothetical protein